MQTDPNVHDIWNLKYRADDEASLDTSLQRVARAIAKPEGDAQHWEAIFYQLLRDGYFLPGGRILAGAGTDRKLTLFNCFVMGLIPDNLNGIFNSLREGALTMQAGGGVGYDFSTLRPSGSLAKATGNIASGPVSFMHIWNAMCATLLTSGARRGAMIASLRCDHPDIEIFINAKRNNSMLNNFNLSVQVSDAFMQAVQNQEEWPLIFPLQEGEYPQGRQIIRSIWPGREGLVDCVISRRVKAAELWDKLMQANYYSGEPGILFTDRINAMNNLYWCEQISCTNPCGEIPLPPYGSCDLGSFNLARFISDPFTDNADIRLDELASATAVAVRFLDNVIDSSHFPLAQQEQKAKQTRRIGLGITGLADALIMLGLHYDSDSARAQAAVIMRTIGHAAYRSSIELAQEKGAFPSFDSHRYLRSRFIASLPTDIIESIQHHGIRNSHLLAIAPAGTISLLAGNVSSGIEPVYAWRQVRKVLEPNGHSKELLLENHAWRCWLNLGGDPDQLPPYFVTALNLSAQAHLLMQASLQPYVDNAISKTINVAQGYHFDEFTQLYSAAFSLGLKGCTTFRTGCRDQSVLSPAPESNHAWPCCAQDVGEGCPTIGQ